MVLGRRKDLRSNGPPPPPAQGQAPAPSPQPSSFLSATKSPGQPRLLRKGQSSLFVTRCKLCWKLRAGEFRAHGNRESKGRDQRGRAKKRAGGQWFRGAEGEVEASLGGVDGHGLVAPPQCPAETQERGIKRGLTWSGWRVLSGLPAIFSLAARGVWAETKPSKL